MKKVIILILTLNFLLAFDLTFTKAFNYFNKGLKTYDINPQKAQDYFKKAYEYIQKLKNKDTSQVYYMLGRMYCNGLGVPKDLDKAEEYFLKALKLGNQRVNCCLARLYIKKGELSKARDFLKKAMSNDKIANYCSDIDASSLKLKGGINETFIR